MRQFRDEIAAVAAIDPEIAAEAVELIEVEYEPLPGVFSPDEALAEGAPLVHEADPRGNPLTSNRMPLSYHHSSGDLAAGEAAAAYIAEGDYSHAADPAELHGHGGLHRRVRHAPTT